MSEEYLWNEKFIKGWKDALKAEQSPIGLTYFTLQTLEEIERLQDKLTTAINVDIEKSREIARLTAENAELREANRWHKTDSDNLNLMPKQDKDVLFITKSNNIIRGHWEWKDEIEEYYKYPCWTDYFDDYECDIVTHWMPLPPMPAEEE